MIGAAQSGAVAVYGLQLAAGVWRRQKEILRWKDPFFPAKAQACSLWGFNTLTASGQKDSVAVTKLALPHWW